LPRYFFFPGFTPGTGGLIRERDLGTQRIAFGSGKREAFWKSCGMQPPSPGRLVVSLFAYGTAPLSPLLGCWEQGAEEVVAVAPEGPAADHMRAYFGGASGPLMRRGRLEARVLPFLPQPRYDQLLWSCAVNFVRGEDSFVRAQWAEQPFVWHIYSQDEGAHRLKLDAFLELYVQGLPAEAATAVRNFWHGWNHIEGAQVNVADAWRAFRSHASTLAAHGRNWAEHVSRGGDLATRLVQFTRERVK
jgi:uncharacterized repeat protein (TIGR03837 family)